MRDADHVVPYGPPVLLLLVWIYIVGITLQAWLAARERDAVCVWMLADHYEFSELGCVDAAGRPVQR